MKDDISDIRRMYDDGVAYEDERLLRHQLEFDLTRRYLDQYLPKTGSVLEVGAGPGQYTTWLARRGYNVTAVDLSEKLLAYNRARLVLERLDGRVDLVHADARDLSSIGEKLFDAALIMGPLYHLVEESDRVLAVSEAGKRLKEDGLIIAAWISRFGPLSEMIKNAPGWIDDESRVRSLLDRGRDPQGAEVSFRGYFARPQEITPFFEGLGFETLVLAGVEPAVSVYDETYNVLEGIRREKWLDLLFEVSAEPSMLGASCHLLSVSRKTA